MTQKRPPSRRQASAVNASPKWLAIRRLVNSCSGAANTSADAGTGAPDTEADDVDDFEALRAAALEQLPPERRSRIAILPKVFA